MDYLVPSIGNKLHAFINWIVLLGTAGIVISAYTAIGYGLDYWYTNHPPHASQKIAKWRFLKAIMVGVLVTLQYLCTFCSYDGGGLKDITKHLKWDDSGRLEYVVFVFIVATLLSYFTSLSVSSYGVVKRKIKKRKKRTSTTSPASPSPPPSQKKPKTDDIKGPVPESPDSKGPDHRFTHNFYFLPKPPFLSFYIPFCPSKSPRYHTK